jgi:uncharacterized iron-regulated membrane protein
MKLSHSVSRRARKIFFFIHLWTGVILGLWFVMIGLTGSTLAWPELIAAEMKIRFPYERPTPNAPQIPFSQAIAAIKKAQPDIKPKELENVIVPSYRFPYYIVMRGDNPLRVNLFLIDPYSGKVHPPLRVVDFVTGKLEYLHIFLLQEAKGLVANGIASLFALFLLLSGLWLWWPSTVRQFKLRLGVKRGGSQWRLLKDLHNVMGIYLYAILFVTTLTAVLMVANTATQQGIEKALGAQNAKPVVIKPTGPRLTDDTLLKHARAALPQTQFLYVMRSSKSDAPFQILFEREGTGFLRGGTIELDPYSGKVLRIKRDSESSAGHKAMGIVEDLHVGLFGGFWSKILYTLAGIMPLGLFVTGLLMWWKRKQKEKTSQLKRKVRSLVVN